MGSTLVERTVGEVLPAVQKNSEMVRTNFMSFYSCQITDTLKKYDDVLEEKAGEVDAFRQKYKIKIKGSSDAQQEASKEDKKQEGIL